MLLTLTGMGVDIDVQLRSRRLTFVTFWFAGTSIYQFLQRCLESLRGEFGELRTVLADQLMYVKEDLILPHFTTFYDLIVTKARGKSGPLFAFHAQDDVRVVHDAAKEKEDSHAGKSSFTDMV